MALQSDQKRPQFPRLFNRYVGMLYAIYLTKYSRLLTSLIEAVNRGDYITYGLVGRSIIEHTATLRYYWDKRLTPIIHAASKRGHLTHDEVALLVDSLDKHLRGSRFDWVAFELREYEALQRKSRFHRKHNRNTTPDQISVVTTIDHWAKDQGSARIAHDLFCDLVHPNVGSSFLVMSRSNDAIAVNANVPSEVGFSIFRKSFPLLVSLAIREASRVLAFFPHIRYQDDELPA